MMGARPEAAGSLVVSGFSLSLSARVFFALDLMQSSTKNAMVAINRPTTSIIIMIPNCLRMSGSLRLTVGSGIGMGGFMTSFFTFSRIPVSVSHMIVFANLPFAIEKLH